jgi:hypothetical protein
MERRCEQCGVMFEAKSAQARFCRGVECDRARARERKQVERAGGDVVHLRPEPDEDLGSAEEATRRTLEEAGRISTPAGQAAIALARRVDRPGTDTGSSQAAAVKQMLAAIDKALEGAKQAEDTVDELRRARERRQAEAASGKRI